MSAEEISSMNTTAKWNGIKFSLRLKEIINKTYIVT
jgi:hypothetical protein